MKNIFIMSALMFSFSGAWIQNTYAMNYISREHIVIGSISAIIGGALYGHIFLPWFTNKREVAERRKQELEHAKKQGQLCCLYHTINARYTAATLPLHNSHALSAYKLQLIADITALQEIVDFKWDDAAEKETVLKLIHYLEEHEKQLTTLFGLTIAKEIQDQYKDELSLLAKDNNLDTDQMARIVYEKYGDGLYKFTAYKTALQEAIAHCKQIGTPPETIQALETLNKKCNYLFANALDQERAAQENAVKQAQLFNVELATKQAQKDLVQAAEQQVQQASQAITHFEEKMIGQQSILDDCHAIMQTIKKFLTTWDMRNEQQTAAIIHEVRQNGQATHNALQAVDTKVSAAERKAQAAERKAEQAQQQAMQAQGLAKVTLPPMPPATNPNYLPPQGNNPEPSAPPFPKAPDKK